MFQNPILEEGVSHIDFNFLVHYPLSGGSPIELSKDLSDETLLQIPFFKFYVQFLTDLKNEQPLKLTQKGNLNRKFVHQLYNHRILPSKYIDDGTIKLMKEEDWAPPHYSHILGKMGGVIKKYKNKLSLTKKGEKLFNNLPSLYQELLKTFTSDFNWAYMSYYVDWVGQYGWAYLLFLLLKHGDEERKADWYSEKYIQAFPQFLPEFDRHSFSTPERQYMNCLNSRFFRGFCKRFGLADIREERPERGALEVTYVTKSALADHLFRLVEY